MRTGLGKNLLLVFMEALGLDPPLTLDCSNLQLQLEGYPIEQGAEIEIPLLPPGACGPAKGFGRLPLAAYALIKPSTLTSLSAYMAALTLRWASDCPSIGSDGRFQPPFWAGGLRRPKAASEEAWHHSKRP